MLPMGVLADIKVQWWVVLQMRCVFIVFILRLIIQFGRPPLPPQLLRRAGLLL